MKISFKDKVEYLRIGLGITGVVANEQACKVIIKVYEMILKKGGAFNVRDAVKIEMEVIGKLTQKQVTAIPNKPKNKTHE